MPFVSYFPGRRTLAETAYLQGWVEGWEETTPVGASPEAVAERRAEAVLRVLEKRRIPVTGSSCLRIIRCTDPETQARWIETAIVCDSVGELFAGGTGDSSDQAEA